MKITDVPQDDAGFLKEGKVRDVCYAVDEEGNYKQVLSVGWDPKNDAIRQAWDQINERAEKIRKKVIDGKSSPLAFYMERSMMSTGLLAQYTGFSRLKVRRHLKPKGFKLLTYVELTTYAEVFNLTIEELKTV